MKSQALQKPVGENMLLDRYVFLFRLPELVVFSFRSIWGPDLGLVPRSVACLLSIGDPLAPYRRDLRLIWFRLGRM